MLAKEGIGSVTMRFAFFPNAIDPSRSPNPMAHAPLSVAAWIASSGSMRIEMQAMDTTRFMLPDGEEPGL